MVYQAGTADLDALATLAALLWDSHSVPELRKEFAAVIEGGDGAFFLKTHGGAPVGFAQCQLRRDYVEGTRSSPVGYLEGILSGKHIAVAALPGSFWQPVKAGRGPGAVPSLPAIAS